MLVQDSRCVQACDLDLLVSTIIYCMEATQKVELSSDVWLHHTSVSYARTQRHRRLTSSEHYGSTLFDDKPIPSTPGPTPNHLFEIHLLTLLD